VSINKEKVADINAQIGEESFINGKYILAQKGKKNYFIIKIA
jgi:tyrosyl-tRNA synthetase